MRNETIVFEIKYARFNCKIRAKVNVVSLLFAFLLELNSYPYFIE